MRLDQYKQPVPEDLVVLPFPNPDSYEKVMNATWYEYKGILLASAKEIDFASETEPEDADIDISHATRIMRVADPLKRVNLIDGYYHA